MKPSLCLSLVSVVLYSVPTVADELFYDDFNSGLSNWIAYGNTSTSDTVVIDGLSAYLKETGSIERVINVSGYSDINVDYLLAARLLESADYCIAEYSTDDGNSYTQMSALTNGQDGGDFYPSSITIPSSNSLTLRFRAQTGGADHCYVENVSVTGTANSGGENPSIVVTEQANFGNQLIDSQTQKRISVANSGTQSLTINSAQVSGADYVLVNNSCDGVTLDNNTSCDVTVQFEPTTSGLKAGTLTLDSNDPQNPTAQVTLSGYGVEDNSGEYTENYQPLTGSGSVSRNQLTYSELNSSNAVSYLATTQAFALPSEAAQPEHNFEGTLTLIAPESAGIGQFTEHRDTFRYTGNGDDPRKHIPDFSFSFVQSGTHLIPVERGINLGSHPYWEYILEPGRVWKENSDNGSSRAAIPFSLIQKNSNCVHNGLMMFTFDNQSVSQVAYQIASETCLYYQFDMWGSVAATYTPHTVADSLAIKQAHQAYERSKIETRALSELVSDYPSIGLNLANIGSGVTPEHMTAYGVFFNGVHYRAECTTRQGVHPYCDRLRMPSYSTAKTAFAGTVSMRLEAMYPGYMNTDLTSLVPETANDPEGDWQDVTPNHALDMATGNYRLSSSSMSDEGSTANDTGFFLVLGHQDKLDYSISRYPRKSAPGSLFIYHTTDTYIATVAAQNFTKSQLGSSFDVFDDVLVADIWSPLGIDEGSKDTRRTYDSEGMPFGGFGLTFLSDDIVKLSKFTSIDRGVVNGQQLLDPAELAIALFEDPTSPPLPTTITDKYYANSMWGKSVTVDSGCDVMIPFMSGYGGIQFVMLPNGVIYYYVSDNDEFNWDTTAIELGKLAPYCN
ncbi:choice-of-anchor D domain-containing protein [Vibrio barjaei]|uniref:choice-of-anchor D domain-containing protein n=1 Tax=Vibrio barjaei TaxID=1676683 RepID=UPI0007BB64F6|nr:choice-of-anchor D domain-containing protein [Vibrio barjaei]OIN28642.1 hypothetical protein AWH66_2021555 [Vibrio barjaei]